MGAYADEAYHPTRGGLYELNARKLRDLTFDPSPAEGKVVKLLYGGVIKLAAGGYRIVFMEREYEEIRQSYIAFFGSDFRTDENSFRGLMSYTKGILRQRGDIDLVCFNYRDVLSDPLEYFKRLNGLGWPIEALKAAAVVDSTQCHYRLENLTVGVL